MTTTADGYYHEEFVQTRQKIKENVSVLKVIWFYTCFGG
jgi:hypothetical protein